MSYFDDNLLASYQAAPQFQSIDSTLRPAKPLAVNCNLGYGNMTRPEKDAAEFYALNHLSTVIQQQFTPHETLPEWASLVMQAHLQCVRDQGCRIVKYLYMITSRESRHIKNSTGQAFWGKFVEKFGQDLMDFNFTLHGKSPDQCAQFLLDHFPPGSIGKYVESLEYIFNHGSFSGGYGGKPWGHIATQLLKFLRGELTLELLLDTAFTLAHNGGPIFNKKMFYHHYDMAELTRVLDVQRSGQMPEYLLDNPHISPFTTGLVKSVKQHVPEAFGASVDWFQVEKLGAIGSYTKEKQHQKVKAPAVPEVTSINGKQVIGQFSVYPGQTVPIVQRKKAA